MVAHPLRQASPIRRIVADTYQSVSGAGGAAMDELRDQTMTVTHGDRLNRRRNPSRSRSM